MKIQELINYGRKKLQEYKIEDDNIKVKVLLSYILNVDKSNLIIHSQKEINNVDEERYKKAINEIIQGKPLQYITNIQEFMGLNFYVNESVLIPQPDTEILVEETIKEIEEKIKYIIESRKVNDKIQSDKLQEENATIKILDMCTGSGAIAISIAKYFQEKKMSVNETNKSEEIKEVRQKEIQNMQVKVYGLDISQKALKIAKKNAETNKVDVTFFKSNMFEKVKNYITEEFDIIVSNPPYIETETIQRLTEEVKSEPHIALDGGKDGLDFYRIIAKDGIKYLKDERKYFSRNRI